jgi:S-adenosylmethionine:tRNA ribosyltransferase-isomerase
VTGVTHLSDVTTPEPEAAGAPPERTGRRRDGVRLMVADRAAGTVRHSVFHRIGEFLDPGDLLVVNVSAVVPASVDGRGAETGSVRLHLSSPVGGDIWTVEPRRPSGIGSERWQDFPGGLVTLPGGASARLLVRDARSPRLWLAELLGFADLFAYLNRFGQPIRYSHTDSAWPLGDYQNVYAIEPGSAETPSAGRPFSTELITRLVASGVLIAPVVLHSGVASFEPDELPDVERYRIPEATARVVNQTRAAGRRVVAVGTTTVRALETVADSAGVVHPGRGTTDYVVTPDIGVRAVDGLVTGWHEAGATHIELVAALAGRDLLEECYRRAADAGYLWHEFGDSLLVLGI